MFTDRKMRIQSNELGSEISNNLNKIYVDKKEFIKFDDTTFIPPALSSYGLGLFNKTSDYDCIHKENENRKKSKISGISYLSHEDSNKRLGNLKSKLSVHFQELQLPSNINQEKNHQLKNFDFVSNQVNEFRNQPQNHYVMHENSNLVWNSSFQLNSSILNNQNYCPHNIFFAHNTTSEDEIMDAASSSRSFSTKTPATILSSKFTDHIVSSGINSSFNNNFGTKTVVHKLKRSRGPKRFGKILGPPRRASKQIENELENDYKLNSVLNEKSNLKIALSNQDYNQNTKVLINYNLNDNNSFIDDEKLATNLSYLNHLSSVSNGLSNVSSYYKSLIKDNEVVEKKKNIFKNNNDFTKNVLILQNGNDASLKNDSNIKLVEFDKLNNNEFGIYGDDSPFLKNLHLDKNLTFYLKKKKKNLIEIKNLSDNKNFLSNKSEAPDNNVHNIQVNKKSSVFENKENVSFMENDKKSYKQIVDKRIPLNNITREKCNNFKSNNDFKLLNSDKPLTNKQVDTKKDPKITLQSNSTISPQKKVSVEPSHFHNKSTESNDFQTKNILKINDNQYEKYELMGRGGSSKVYKVRSCVNNKLYAVKKVIFDKFDDSCIKGFKGEIELLTKLKKTNRVIKLFDYMIEEGSITLVMECGEIDLAHVLQNKIATDPILDINFVKYHSNEIFKCLKVVHQSSIVHSDLKPANFIFVKGILKIIDFGIANIVPDHTVNIYRQTQIGTPNYMAPEALIEINHSGLNFKDDDQKKSKSKVNTWKVGKPSDIWSCGCIMYQMIYGKPPYAVYSGNQRIMAIMNPNVKIQYPDHGIGKVEVPKSAIDLMKKCLCRNPHERFTIDECLNSEFLNSKVLNKVFIRELVQLAVDFGYKKKQIKDTYLSDDTHNTLVDLVLKKIDNLNYQ